MPVQVHELVSQCTWQVTVELVSIYSLGESCPPFCWDRQRKASGKETLNTTGSTWGNEVEWQAPERFLENGVSVIQM